MYIPNLGANLREMLGKIGVARVDEVYETHALYDAPALYVKTRYDSLCKHVMPSLYLSGFVRLYPTRMTQRPAGPLVSVFFILLSFLKESKGIPSSFFWRALPANTSSLFIFPSSGGHGPPPPLFFSLIFCAGEARPAHFLFLSFSFLQFFCKSYCLFEVHVSGIEGFSDYYALDVPALEGADILYGRDPA